MAVNIDTVYQKVLALTSKEQRGYLTPQEFNLMADKAQRELFANYFHDLKTAYYKSKTNRTYSDDLEMVREKLATLKAVSTVNQLANSSSFSMPDNIWFINTIETVVDGKTVQLTELTDQDVLYTENNPLTKATKNRPVYVRNNLAGVGITLYPTPTEATTYTLNVYKEPTTPKWAYVVVKGRALYNNIPSKDFMLHSTEEENLVSRILQLAGVVIEKPGLIEVGTVERANTKQEQND